MQSEVKVALSSSSITGTGEIIITSRSQRARGEPGGDMKKYTKLGLALVAVISSLSFLIYKYRYDRLYHVMQDSKCPVCQNSSILSHIAIVRFSSVGLVSCQHLGQGIWVFGAHCSTGAACSGPGGPGGSAVRPVV